MRIKGGTAFILAAIVGIGVYAVGSLSLSGKQAEYLEEEAKLPESAVTTYLNHVKNQEYDAIYEDSLKVQSHFNSQEDYVAELESVFEGVNINDIEYAGLDNTDGTKSYTLYNNGYYLTDLKLIQADDGTWIASTIFTGKQTYEIEVPEGVSIAINGIELDSSYLLNTGVEPSNFVQMNNMDIVPKVDIYEVTNLLGEPEVEVVGETGYTTMTDVLTNHILVGRESSDADLEEMVIEYAKILAMYPATDSSWSQVAAISYTNSDWYSDISGMQNYWFTDHDTYNFSNEEVLTMIQQSDDTICAHVIFDYYASDGTVDRTWNCGYQMTLIEISGSWKICSMAIDNELNPVKAAWLEEINS